MGIYTVILQTVTCSECGVTFGAPDNFIESRERDHEKFYCPNGHNQYFPGESREEKLKRQLEATSRQLSNTQSRLATEKRSHAATKGVLTKTKKRVGNGLCPVCTRHFVNLERHMHGMHPGYEEGGQ